MTKRDLVLRISAQTGLVQDDVLAVIQKMLDHIAEGLARGHRFEFRDFGVFYVQTRNPRLGRNPKDPNNPIRIPARKAVKFKMSKKLKASLARKT